MGAGQQYLRISRIRVLARVRQFLPLKFCPNSRAGWAATNLIKAWLLERVACSHVRTTTRGKEQYAARARRRTETTPALGQATIEAAKRNRLIWALCWITSGAHTEPDWCDEKARRFGAGARRVPAEDRTAISLPP
jgi:hypothetical protein